MNKNAGVGPIGKSRFQTGVGSTITHITTVFRQGSVIKQSHIDKLMEGVIAWNSFVKQEREKGYFRPDLSEADLKGTKLKRADLQGADLFNADLSGADLGESNLEGANLQDANLRKARLGGADLEGAKLLGAKLY